MLAAHRFTNVYRASDRVSQYLIRHVQYGVVRDAESTVFRTLLFKLFNRIETWNLLEESFGKITWQTFDFDRYARVLDRAFAREADVPRRARLWHSAARPWVSRRTWRSAQRT